MVIGVLQIELSIEGAASLKDKRRVVSSLKDRLHREHQVSVAEVGQQENHAAAVLGIVLASSDATHCRTTLDGVLNKIIRHQRGYVLEDHATEIISGR